ncbi:MAG: ferrous iron transport protein A [Firmicutes bacterium]|nr:ferrous iron transport protein A [Bacillota bacterium]
MKKLSELGTNAEGIIAGINGDARFISRITSIGLTPGCKVKVVKNEKSRPMLVYSRDTMIALNRSECGHSCSGCSGCSGGTACSGCMPEGGFKNMGAMWEVS